MRAIKNTSKHTSALDTSGQQVHRSGGTNSGDVVRFQEPNYVSEGVKTVLDCKSELVVHSVEVLGDFTRLDHVGTLFRDTNTEGVKARPPSYSIKLARVHE
jgi:hypothetical protein